MYTPQITGDRIRTLAYEKGMTLDKLQKEIGVSSGTILQSSKSEFGMKAKNLYLVAELLECSVDYLLGRTDEPSMPQKVCENNCIQNVNGDGVGNMTQNNGIVNSDIDMRLAVLTTQERYRAIADIIDLLDEKYSK